MPNRQAPADERPETHVLITRAKLYPEVARPGPAWQWSYNYFVNGGPVCQYGPGLTSLRRMLREKFGRNVEIVKAWETSDAEAAKSART